VLTWPLPVYLRSHLLGGTGGDTGIYIWNLWIFRHELLRHARLPFSTDHVFAYTGGADFSLHNYTPIAGLLGFPLIGPLGVVGAYNAVMILFIALTGAGAYVLARYLRLSRWSAGLCGALFAASPVITARETAHLSLVIAPALPLFLWSLLRALDTRSLRDAVFTGAFVALAAYSDAYYGIYCVLMGAFVVAWRFTTWSRGEVTPAAVMATRAVDILTTLVAAVVVWRVIRGPVDLAIAGVTIQLQTLYTPVLALAGLIAARMWLTWCPRVRIDDPDGALRRLVKLGALAVAVCAAMMTPLLLGLARRAWNDELPEVEVFWRSSPRGVDLLAYLVPNPNHPWFGDTTRPWLLPPRTDAFPEFIASFPLVALTVIAVAAWRGWLPRFWIAFTACFALLSLGPFVYVGGVNTFVPGPWALLRYVPVLNLARSPSRFAVVAALGLALLAAFAAQELWRRRAAKAPMIAVALALALTFELLPAPRPLHAAVVPQIYDLVATTANHPKEVPRLLELPTGVRDGTSSIGDFNPASPFFQTRHRRPVVGGYLSRVSKLRKRRNAADPMMFALTELSAGRTLSAEAAAQARNWREQFLRRSCVRYVILDEGRAPDGMRDPAIDLLGLVSVHRDEKYELFTPVDPPSCDPIAKYRRRSLSP
jgi:hypothetical protein